MDGVIRGLQLCSHILKDTKLIDSLDNDLPIVDLGYEKHQAIAFNQTGDYYNFSNIRYAEPPTGRARWSPPRKPHPNLDSVQNGSIPRVCPQANPAWELTAVQFIPQYLAGLGASSAKVKRATEFTQAELDAAEMQEDCLFLDVFSPRKIFDSPDDGRSGAPVLGKYLSQSTGPT